MAATVYETPKSKLAPRLDFLRAQLAVKKYRHEEDAKEIARLEMQIDDLETESSPVATVDMPL